MKESTSALPFIEFYREIFAKRKKVVIFLTSHLLGQFLFHWGVVGILYFADWRVDVVQFSTCCKDYNLSPKLNCRF